MTREFAIALFVLCLLLLVVACAKPAASKPPTATVTALAATVARPTATAVPKPTIIADLPVYLERVLPPEAKGHVEFITPGFVSAFFALEDSRAPRTNARRYARNFLFAAYDTGLPLQGVQIVMLDANDRPGLSLTLGANVAAREPASTWTNDDISPTMFLKWMKERAKAGFDANGADAARIGGAWAN